MRVNDDLIAKYLSGECSEDEEAVVEGWVSSDPENERLMEQLRSVWKAPERGWAVGDTRNLWMRVAEDAGIDDTIVPATRRRGVLDGFFASVRTARRLRYAAVALLAAGLGFAGLRLTGLLRPGMETVSVAVGKRVVVRLEDGSRVTLDAGSELVYPRSFSGDRREVSLTGEGYFEVAADADRPFIVEAQAASIRVLGTTFNVRAWDVTERVEVAVVEGRVSLGTRAGDIGTDVVIAEDQLSIMPVGGVPSVPRVVDVDRYLGWLEHEVSFEDVPLKEVLHQLERWYRVEFVFEDPAVAEERVTMRIRERSVDDIVELVSMLAGLRYRREGSQIVFLP